MNRDRRVRAKGMVAEAMLLVSLIFVLKSASAPSASGPFDFSLAGGGALAVAQGASVSSTMTATVSSGAAEPVEFIVSGLPAGATYLFSTASCRPTCTSTLTIMTTASTPAGRYPVNVRAIGAGSTRFAPVLLTVTAVGPPASGKFANFNRIRTAGRLEVRATASASSPLLGVQSSSAVGTVVGGPVAADGVVWWNISYDGGPSGWSAEHLLAKASTATGLRGDCSSEGRLTGRTDIVFCEPWEDPAWWQNGYLSDGAKTRHYPATPSSVARTTLVTTGCISGKCLAVRMLKGEAGALAVHWPLQAAGQHPDELFVRYYLKLSANFDPRVCAPDGTVVDSGGKFPGPADVRTDADPGGQCGNGGNPADGIHCWSMRSKFRDCYGGSSGPACTVPGAVVRVGHYAYFYRTRDFWGVSGYWDQNSWDQSVGDGGVCRSTANNLYCGIGNAGQLVGNRWYRLEIHVKMNAPGQADGILRAWVDGVKAFDKSNMIYRLPGHDDLHVRTMWLNVHTGGDVPNGNCREQTVWLDQLVLATGSLPGAWSQ